MANKGRSFGLSAEAERKKEAKYDPDLEAQVRDWINQVLGRKVLKPEADQEDFVESLKSGAILVELANAVGGKIKVNQSKLAFKMIAVMPFKSN
ncbi:hypothetical protein ACROYT_G021430 [Oculina patagonica]